MTPPPPASAGISEPPRELGLVSFRLGSALFAVDIMRISEVVAFRPSSIPSPPSSFIRGIVTLRGAHIPVMDLRSRFRMTPPAEKREGELIVVRLAHGLLALSVDQAGEVLTVPAERIVPAPDLVGFGAECVLGICLPDGDRLLMILDIDRLMGGE